MGGSLGSEHRGSHWNLNLALHVNGSPKALSQRTEWKDMVSERTFGRSGLQARAQGGSWAVAQAESCASVGKTVGLERRGDVGSERGSSSGVGSE